MILYEYPFNERVRTLLRLEDLHQKLHFFLQRTQAYDHQIALELVFELTEVLSRSDLKSEILQELTRQKLALQASFANPHQQSRDLNALAEQIESVRTALVGAKGKTGQHLLQIEWLSTIRNRLVIPGGASEFDLPSYHAWQQKPHEERLRDLSLWISPFIPFFDAMKLVLSLLRENGRGLDLTAEQGAYERLLRDNTAYQMLRLEVEEHRYIPEISANKYMLRIRFTEQDSQFKLQMVHDNVPFRLILCNF